MRLRFDIAPDSCVSYASGNLTQGKRWRWASINLVWSFWIIAAPLLSDTPWRIWLPPTLLSYMVFLWLYFRAQSISVRRLPGYVLAIGALGFLLSPLNFGGMVYEIYACVFAASAFRSPRAGLIAMLLIMATYVLETWWLGWSWPNIASAVLWALAVGGMSLMSRAKGRSDAQLRLSHDEVRRLAATAERERISRDLHDLLGHTLSLIALKLELSRKLFDRDTEGARREVEEAEKVARHALAEVRSAVSGIRAADLAAELASARLLLESSRVHCAYDHPPADLPDDVERGLSLILREAVTNIARHADATQARIEMERAPASVRLQISDNGRGGIDGEGNGLCGMRERVRVLGGTLVIASPRGGGTRVEIEVPMPVMRLVQPVRSSPDLPSAGSLATTASGHSAA
ncbi:MAG TPA: sensor histidine kinase [Rhodanobacter sp.]|nr:sensor histidine kinase [Rhodanobacter sp.]